MSLHNSPADVLKPNGCGVVLLVTIMVVTCGTTKYGGARCMWSCWTRELKTSLTPAEGIRVSQRKNARLWGFIQD